MRFDRVIPDLRVFEHHGDGTPGTVVYVDTTDVASRHAELHGTDYPHLSPGLDNDEIGTHVFVVDPFGNTLRFNQRPSGRESRAVQVGQVVAVVARPEAVAAVRRSLSPAARTRSGSSSSLAAARCTAS